MTPTMIDTETNNCDDECPSMRAEELDTVEGWQCPWVIDGSGTLRVERGRGIVAAVLARMSGHRRDGAVSAAMSVSVATSRREFGRESSTEDQRWTRTIDGRPLTTAAQPSSNGFVERRRPLDLHFCTRSIDGSGAAAELVQAMVRLGPLRLPIPDRWRPRIVCETHRNGPALVVHVRIVRPCGMLIVDYSGTLS